MFFYPAAALAAILQAKGEAPSRILFFSSKGNLD
jgi:hypothetical protein